MMINILFCQNEQELFFAESGGDTPSYYSCIIKLPGFILFCQNKNTFFKSIKRTFFFDLLKIKKNKNVYFYELFTVTLSII